MLGAKKRIAVSVFQFNVVGNALAQRTNFCFRKPFANPRNNLVIDNGRGRVGDQGQNFGHSPTDYMMEQAGVIFIAGPTAAGKSGAALAIADRLGGEIVNADAMQVYSDLRIITARPSAADEARAPHHLYGVIDGAERCSAGRWARMAAPIIEDIRARNRVAVIVGGTGLYFRALEDGLSPIPDVPPEIREKGVERRAALGPDAFREEVIARDAAMARLPAGDAQRLVRAWEVFEATGQKLSDFQAMARTPMIAAPVRRVIVEPTRAALYARCDARAAAMLSDGAINEVVRLRDRGLDKDLPVMKAFGVPEILTLLAGDCDDAACLAALQQSTRRFAKRQLTWFRNQAAHWPRVESSVAAAEFFLRGAV